jgi:homopolymeric O-antigen transport system ATP-binding protein
MSNIIEIKNISKQYKISHQDSNYLTLRDVLTNVLKSPLKSFKNKILRSKKEIFWALDGLTLSIKKGEKIGIIGSNGAGKSTLLKILSSITPPSSGEIEINGKIASLLEVGTGFHPELTGRENIYLNGAILGMTKTEIKDKFNDIVEFSGIENFLDTPVKRYSSGMYVRLAFSVAAHMEPDILLVDEVLAVGDVAFQKKCIGKMNEVSQRSGRTILFVSHNMGAIQNLCEKSLLLKNGKIEFFGDTETAIKKYLSSSQTDKQDIEKRHDRKGNQLLKIKSIKMTDLNNKEINHVLTGEKINFIIEYEGKEENLKNVIINLSIDSNLGQRVLMLSNEFNGQIFNTSKKSGQFICTIEKPNLNIGNYNITSFITVNGQTSDWVKNIYNFSVEDGDFYKNGKNPEKQDGFLLTNQEWRIKDKIKIKKY